MLGVIDLDPGGRARTARRRLDGLISVDLPVDLIIVLEQQERADHGQRSEEAPRERRRVG
jgi:hypothetical protein